MSYLIGCAILTISAAGCEVFSARNGALDSSGKKLPQIAPSSDSIEVEILYAERPVGDRLLGATLPGATSMRFSRLNRSFKRTWNETAFESALQIPIPRKRCRS